MQRKKNFIDLFWMSFVLTQKVIEDGGSWEFLAAIVP